MKTGLFLLIFIFLFIPRVPAHITERERPWIEGMRNAAAEQQAEIDALKGRITEAETRRSAAETHLEATEKSYGELQVEHIALQGKVNDVVEWGAQQEAEKHSAQIDAEEQRGRVWKWLLIAAVSWLVSAALLAVIVFRRALVAQFPFLAFLT